MVGLGEWVDGDEQFDGFVEIPRRFMINAILFDLDNTLYSERCGIFRVIDRRMNEWLMSRLDVPAKEVNDFRNKYFVRYGTTLRGLMLHHNVDPKDYLEYVHDVPVSDFLSEDVELRGVLERIKARKLIFTNSNRKHALRILGALGVQDLFEKIFDIEAMQFVPKPSREPYMKALNYLRLPPEECLLIDDLERNLKPAKQLGMDTILIGGGPAEDGHRRASDIGEIEAVLEQIAGNR